MIGISCVCADEERRKKNHGYRNNNEVRQNMQTVWGRDLSGAAAVSEAKKFFTRPWRTYDSRISRVMGIFFSVEIHKLWLIFFFLFE